MGDATGPEVRKEGQVGDVCRWPASSCWADWLYMHSPQVRTHIRHPPINQKTFTEYLVHIKDTTLRAEGRPMMKQKWLVPTSWKPVSFRADRRHIHLQCKKKMIFIIHGMLFSGFQTKEGEGGLGTNSRGLAMRLQGWTAFRCAQLWAEGAIHLEDSIKTSPPTLLLALLSLLPPNRKDLPQRRLEVCVVILHRKGSGIYELLEMECQTLCDHTLPWEECPEPSSDSPEWRGFPPESLF